jgi:hypothetical protein
MSFSLTLRRSTDDLGLNQPSAVLIPFFNGSEKQGREKFSAFFDAGPVADLTRSMQYEVVNSSQV